MDKEYIIIKEYEKVEIPIEVEKIVKVYDMTKVREKEIIIDSLKKQLSIHRIVIVCFVIFTTILAVINVK